MILTVLLHLLLTIPVHVLVTGLTIRFPLAPAPAPPTPLPLNEGSPFIFPLIDVVVVD